MAESLSYVLAKLDKLSQDIALSLQRLPTLFQLDIRLLERSVYELHSRANSLKKSTAHELQKCLEARKCLPVLFQDDIGFVDEDPMKLKLLRIRFWISALKKHCPQNRERLQSVQVVTELIHYESVRPLMQKRSEAPLQCTRSLALRMIVAGMELEETCSNIDQIQKLSNNYYDGLEAAISELEWIPQDIRESCVSLDNAGFMSTGAWFSSDKVTQIPVVGIDQTERSKFVRSNYRGQRCQTRKATPSVDKKSTECQTRADLTRDQIRSQRRETPPSPSPQRAAPKTPTDSNVDFWEFLRQDNLLAQQNSNPSPHTPPVASSHVLYDEQHPTKDRVKGKLSSSSSKICIFSPKSKKSPTSAPSSSKRSEAIRKVFSKLQIKSPKFKRDDMA